MKLIILAAGTGSRLLPLTQNTPKSLLDLGDGTSILERQIQSAVESPDITHIVIVTGYKSEQIEAKIKAFSQDIPIQIVYNPFFDVSNNLMSVWCTHYLMEGADFMISNGDNLYKPGVVAGIIQSLKDRTGIFITTNPLSEPDEDTMKVVLNGDSIQKIAKTIPIKDAHLESVGLAIIKGKWFQTLFRDKVLELSRDKSYHQKFWLEIFNELIQDHTPIQPVNIKESDWQEMDFHPDIALIKMHMTAQLSEFNI